MVAQRVGRGGGWGGSHICYLFVCMDCSHKVVLENPRTRRQTGLAGVVLLLGACVAGFVMAQPGGTILAGAGGLLGAWGVYAGFFRDEHCCPIIGHDAQTPARSAPIEKHLYVSDRDHAKGRMLERWVPRLIYAVLAITVLVLLYDTVARAESEPQSIETCSRLPSQIQQKDCLRELLTSYENALAYTVGQARKHWKSETVQYAFDAAQDAWGLYLDRQCEAAFAMVGGGSDASAAQTRCRIILIEQRLEHLTQPGF